MTQDLPAPLVVSVTSACHQLKLSKPKLYELLRRGELTSYTDGKSRKIVVASMEAYIQRKIQASKQFERLAMRGRPAA